MQVFYEGTLDRVISKSFEDKHGDAVEFNELHFYTKSESGEAAVIVVNTKLDLNDLVGKSAILGLDIDPSMKNKPRVISCLAK